MLPSSICTHGCTPGGRLSHGDRHILTLARDKVTRTLCRWCRGPMGRRRGMASSKNLFPPWSAGQVLPYDALGQPRGCWDPQGARLLSLHPWEVLTQFLPQFQHLFAVGIPQHWLRNALRSLSSSSWLEAFSLYVNTVCLTVFSFHTMEVQSMQLNVLKMA